MSAPLTDLEKARVLYFLGYSTFEDDGPAVRALNSLAAHTLAPDFIRPLLDRLEIIDKDIFQLRDVSLAISTGGVQTRVMYSFDFHCKLGRQYVGRLSSFTKISIFSDVFSSGAGRRPETFYSGDPSEHRVDRMMGVPTVTSGE